MSDPGIWPYTPVIPPDDVNPDLARWAFNQFQDVSDALGARPEPLAILTGAATPMTVNATRNIITGYPTVYEGEGFRNTANGTTGVITLPYTGLYQVVSGCVGSHSTATQNEAAMMFIRTPGGDSDVAGWPIATNKITGATFNANFLLAGNEGDTWSLGLYATVPIGTFTFTGTQFTVQLSTV